MTNNRVQKYLEVKKSIFVDFSFYILFQRLKKGYSTVHLTVGLTKKQPIEKTLNFKNFR